MIPDYDLEFNSNIKGDWEGGDLTSDGGAMLIRDFLDQLKFPQMAEELFFIPSDDVQREHTNAKMFIQFVFLTILGYHNQKNADELRKDPAISSYFNEEGLASQSSESRFVNRLDEGSLDQLTKINQVIVENYYKESPPKSKVIIFDLDTSYCETHGSQEGGSYNTHYGCKGLSPLMMFDNETRLLIESDLREGTTYCSNGAADLIIPVFESFQEKFPDLTCRLRGDSGFASPEVYEACEKNGAQYVIRLKSNQVLQRKALNLLSKEYDPERFFEDQVMIGEFKYKAKSWEKERRVVCELKHTAGELVPSLTYLVTNVKEMTPEEALAFYRKRGSMENFIKEAKNGFAIDKVSQKELIVNKNQFMMKMIAYNLMCIFSAFALPKSMKKHQIETLRNKLFKVAARKVKHARQVTLKFCSHFPLKREFAAILQNIKMLKINFSPG